VHTDVIIVGQGICGSILSWLLVKGGKRVVVIDEARPFAPGMVASGLINPVTGMRVARTWMADELLPVAEDIYRQMEADLGAQLYQPFELLDFHASRDAKHAFDERIAKGAADVHNYEHDEEWKAIFSFHYGISAIGQCAVVDMRSLQAACRQILQEKGALLQERFDHAQCIVTESGVQYKEITAEKIIFCEGYCGMQNPWFGRLPYALNKGEALIVRIPDLPRTHILKQSMKIVPWEGNDLFWVGSSFEWTYDNVRPTEKFLLKAKQQLDLWLKLPYTIEHHWAAERPATVDHKPFVGFHPLHPPVGVLNGMGAKGCLQTPYFARVMANHILHGEPLHREADVARYTRILSR